MLVASAVLPMVAYTLTASPGPYWLDSSELVAAGYLGGIPHPPGHPLYVALSNPAGLWPFGSISLRMNLTSALAMAAAMAVLAVVARRVLVHLGSTPQRASTAAMLATLVTASSYAVWFQAVRAEVYALHLLCVSMIVGLAVEMELQASSAQKPDARLLMAMAFITGLALANHHYLTVFVGAPVVLLIAARGAWRRTLFSRAGAKAVGLGFFGLCTYALLPLRALREPLVNYGNPDNLRDFWWVITAQAFQQSLGRAQEVDLAKLGMDLAGQMSRQLTPAGLIIALVALVWLLKSGRRRGLGLLLLGLLTLNLLTQSLMNFDPLNPDVHGYFALSVWTLGLLLALAWGGLDSVCRHIVETQTPREAAVARHLPAVGLAGLAVLVVINTTVTAPDARLDGFHDVELTTLLMLEPLPEGAVLLTSNYKTIFSLWEAQGVSQRRGDVKVIHRNFLPTPSYEREVRSRFPELGQLILDRDGDGKSALDFSATRALARHTPVYMEFDLNIEDGVAAYLVPDGLFMRVNPDPVPGPVSDEVRERQQRLWIALEDRLGVHSQPRALELETRRHLMWMHYLTCKALLAGGRHQMALFHLNRAMALNPASPELWALARELGLETPSPVPLPPQ